MTKMRKRKIKVRRITQIKTNITVCEKAVVLKRSDEK